MRIGVAFGGKAVEHHHSVTSALYILSKIERDGDDVHALYFAGDGRPARRADAIDTVLRALRETTLFAPGETAPSSPEPRIRGYLEAAYDGSDTFTLGDLGRYDIVFPVFHGQGGEDGLIQGLLEMLDVPYVGCDLLSTVVANDKDLAKRLVRESGVPVARHTCVTAAQWQEDAAASLASLERRIGLPLFVKPASLGSSIGVSRAADRAEARHALDQVFRLCPLAVVEEALDAREFGVGLIGLGEPSASLPLEFGKPDAPFMDHEAKYGPGAVDDDIPARIDDELSGKLRASAAHVWRVLRLTGMARVDFFLCSDGRLLFNEVNTVPGFGRTSVFSRIWHASGVPLNDLVERLIGYGRERQNARRRLQFSLDAHEEVHA